MGRVVVALGGNALSRAGERGTWEETRENVREAVLPIARLVARGWEVIVTHGNGPQVGNLLLQQEATREVPPLPLDAVGAATEGWIGYLLQIELAHALAIVHARREPFTVVTRVEVSSKDPAFHRPTKPVGPFYQENTARLLQKQMGWTMIEDTARGGWRRVVPSPLPLRILEGPLLRQWMDEGLARRAVPIVAGGGGVPVLVRRGGHVSGVEAVIDKDRTAAILASTLGADTLAILTDVPAVSIAFHTPRERRLGRTSPAELEGYARAGEFGEGSMGPKVEAALDFLAHGGDRALITDGVHFTDGMKGKAGTIVERPGPAAGSA